jgi:hypothetical protein
MKSKTGFLILLLVFLKVSPCFGQTLVGSAAGDFYSAFAKIAKDEMRLTTLEVLKPYITPEVFQRLDDNLVYRAAFIAFAASQYGVISGMTSSVGFNETLNALTGFLMIIEESGEIKEWTVNEVSTRYEQLLASSWRNVNPSLFAVMLEAYCSYMRGELWGPE